jgi:probable F420-dependent oxidoreductase
MRFGIGFANTAPFADAAGAVQLASLAEAAGFESVWTIEHVVYPDDYASTYPYGRDGKMPAVAATPMPDPLVWLTWVAARTTTIRLGTGILILPLRNPVLLAKEIATLDAMSGGRTELGVGVGWLREEFDALGVPWAGRGARTDDAVAAMRALWAADHASHDGPSASFHDVSCNPKPVHGSVPVTIGGHTEAAAARAGRLGDGFFPAKGSLRRLTELFDIVRASAVEAGRDPEAVVLSAAHPAFAGRDVAAMHEAAAALGALGVSRIVVPAFVFAREPERTFASFAEHVTGA